MWRATHWEAPELLPGSILSSALAPRCLQGRMLNTQTHTLDVSTRGHICRNPSLCRFLAGNGCESRMKPQGAAFGEELLCRGEASGNFWPPAVAPGPTAALQHSVFRAAASRNHGQDQNSSCRHFSNFSPLLRVLCIFQCCFFFFFFVYIYWKTLLFQQLKNSP